MNETPSFKTFLINEDLKRFGKLKLSRPRDDSKSFRFNMARGMNRKNLNQVPDSHSATKNRSRDTLMGFIRGLNTSNKVVDIAKRAPSGVWRISNKQVTDIATKYKFNAPTAEKPMKHLGSTGIQIIRFKPGVFYLYKPRKTIRKRRRKLSASRSKNQSLFSNTWG